MGRRGPVRPAYGSGEENQTSELRESGVAGPADLRRRSQGASCLLPRSRGRGSGWGTGNGAARDGPTGGVARARGIGRLNCESVVAGRLIWGRSAAPRNVELRGPGFERGSRGQGISWGSIGPPVVWPETPLPAQIPPPFSVGGSHDNAEALAARGRTGVQRPQGGWRALAGGGRSGGKAAARRRRRRPVGTSLGPSRSPFPARSRPLSRAGGGAGSEGAGPPGNRKPARKRSQRRIAGDLGRPDAPAEALEGPGEDSV